ncbi:hypothetical protein EVAR_85105_1 [Eumeta japonica]|uniref:Uncharacterized protein n=1 Tax=Eumeta variegata TaxID=151549 RepID=A0A4C1XUF7_EUMVA|nr:hypothetical protein EVAR_85105_1 [Eumeta japonica]
MKAFTPCLEEHSVIDDTYVSSLRSALGQRGPNLRTERGKSVAISIFYMTYDVKEISVMKTPHSPTLPACARARPAAALVFYDPLQAYDSSPLAFVPASLESTSNIDTASRRCGTTCACAWKLCGELLKIYGDVNFWRPQLGEAAYIFVAFTNHRPPAGGVPPSVAAFGEIKHACIARNFISRPAFDGRANIHRITLKLGFIDGAHEHAPEPAQHEALEKSLSIVLSFSLRRNEPKGMIPYGCFSLGHHTRPSGCATRAYNLKKYTDNFGADKSKQLLHLDELRSRTATRLDVRSKGRDDGFEFRMRRVRTSTSAAYAKNRSPRHLAAVAMLTAEYPF